MRSRNIHWLTQVAFGTLTAASLLLAARPGAAVGTQRIELRSGDDFKGGELQGVSVDSNGKLRAGFNLGSVPLADATSIWSALVQKDGSVLLGTGDEGRLYKYANGNTTLLAEAKGMTLSALAEAFGGNVIVGSIASGTLMRWQGGKLSDFSKLPGVDHVYCLAYDAKAKVLYAGTGPEGKLFRISANGDAQVYFDAEEQHLVSVAVGHNGQVFAGASDKARLYSITGPGRASVLYDFGRTEVRAVAVAPNDEVYAIANEIKQEARPSERRPGQRDSAVPVAAAAPAKGKGTLYRFSSAGVPEELIDDGDDYFVSLVLGDDNRPYVGSGVEGRVYTVSDSHAVILLADTSERQVTALALSGAQRFVFSSDPAVIHPVRGMGGADAVWTSKPMDLQLRAKFGRMSWLASGKVELSTRSGNTSDPDKTWSDWSAPLTD
ncbi:MAG TPA: hypothetical protein VL137_15385, partial [Polyangiaceae bacterium]|nr:hypothetical protein [Polyangiaceae bacterium]